MVSIVVGARNDEYGINFLGRFQNFVDVLLPLLHTHASQSELIVVEWNPPADRPRLAQAVHWPDEAGDVRTRIIEVSPAQHASIPGSDRMPFFEFIAKNVGVRRAAGEHILVTNPDVFFTPSLAALLGGEPFPKEWFFRMDRFDTRIPAGLPRDPYQALIEADRGIFCAHIMDKSIPIDDAARSRAIETKNWPSTTHRVGHMPRSGFIAHFDNVVGKNWGLHTNGAGDFLLTHRENWDLIRGFPEYTDTCTHLDSYACYQLKAAGVRQALITLPCRLIHQDHSRLESSRRPRGVGDKWIDDLLDIEEGRLGPVINGLGWGLGTMELHETEVRGG